MHVLLLILVAASTCAQDLASWRILPANGPAPSARVDGVLAYDTVSGAVFLFGGRDNAARNDLWSYSFTSNSWTELRPANPPPARFGHTLAYDAPRRRLLVFGGQASGFFSDVWAYDIAQNTWRQLARDNAGPSRRYGHSAVIDSARNRMIISHGFTDAGRFDDTWSFDLNTANWQNISPAANTRPLRRCLHHAVLDAAGDQMFLYGGCASGAGPCPLGDLWSFDLVTHRWTERTANTGQAKPPGRQWYGLGFDPNRRRLVLYGGSGERGSLRDAWEYDPAGGAWNALSLTPEAPIRDRHEATFVPGQGTLFFGGNGPAGLTNDLLLFPAAPALRVVNAFSQQEGPLAPGQLISIHGAGFGSGMATAPDLTMPPTELAGVQVVIGGRPAGLLYVGERQINAQTPPGLAAPAESDLTVRTAAGVSSQRVTLASQSPGLHPVAAWQEGLLGVFVTGMSEAEPPRVDVNGAGAEVVQVLPLAGVVGVLEVCLRPVVALGPGDDVVIRLRAGEAETTATVRVAP